MIVINGHGGRKAVAVSDAHVIAGLASYDPELGIKVLDSNPQIARGKIVYLFTCNAMRELGPAMREQGASAVAGFTKPFLFLVSSFTFNPLEDELAKPFFNSALTFARKLIDGYTVGEAYTATIKAFRKEAEKAQDSGDIQAARYLIFNMTNFKVLGEPFVKII
jgi:hypothetical protein